MPRRGSREKYGEDWSSPLRMILRIIIMLIIVGVALQIFFSFSNSMFYAPMYYHYGWVWALIGLIFFLWFVGWTFGWPWRYRYYMSWSRGDPEEIAKMRYANGDITESQYRQILKNLRTRQ